jgi:hypothetical protein
MAVPAFFMVGREDFLARPGRLKELFDKYGSPNKQFFLIEGMHQTMRDQKVQEKASAFIKEVLDTEEFIRLSTGSTRTDETSGLLVENHPKLQQG